MQILKQDLTAKSVNEAIVKFAPDFIFHLAAQGNVRKSVTDPMFDAQVNILGTINLLEAARESQAKGFIFSSTGGAVYGEQLDFPATESHQTVPECPYGLSKRAVEYYLQYYGRTHNFKTVALRYANVYGPRQNPKGETGVLAVFLERLLQKQPLKINGDGEQTRDFIYVADVVDANFKTAAAIAADSLKTEQNFTVFNVGSGIETNVNQIVDELKKSWAKISKKDWPTEVTLTHGPALPGEQRRSVIDASKLKNQLGWKVSVNINEGVEKTLLSFLK